MPSMTRPRSARLSVVALATALPFRASAATAAPEGLEYDGLGDSYASGVGAAPYDPASGGCARSDAGYPALLDGRMKISLDDFAACSGATTATLVSGGQLEALDAAGATPWAPACSVRTFCAQPVCSPPVPRSPTRYRPSLPTSTRRSAPKRPTRAWSSWVTRGCSHPSSASTCRPQQRSSGT